MPIYEYICIDCRKRVSVFFRKMSEASDEAARCPECDGANLHRLASRVRVLKSGESRTDALADDVGLMSALEHEDPQTMARVMRQMSRDTNQPLDDDTGEILDRLESGQTFTDIEQSMPNLSDASENSLDDEES